MNLPEKIDNLIIERVLPHVADMDAVGVIMLDRHSFDILRKDYEEVLGFSHHPAAGPDRFRGIPIELHAVLPDLNKNPHPQLIAVRYTTRNGRTAYADDPNNDERFL